MILREIASNVCFGVTEVQVQWVTKKGIVGARMNRPKKKEYMSRKDEHRINMLMYERYVR